MRRRRERPDTGYYQWGTEWMGRLRAQGHWPGSMPLAWDVWPWWMSACTHVFNTDYGGLPRECRSGWPGAERAERRVLEPQAGLDLSSATPPATSGRLLHLPASHLPPAGDGSHVCPWLTGGCNCKSLCLCSGICFLEELWGG